MSQRKDQLHLEPFNINVLYPKSDMKCLSEICCFNILSAEMWSEAIPSPKHNLISAAMPPYVHVLILMGKQKQKKRYWIWSSSYLMLLIKTKCISQGELTVKSFMLR